MSGLHLFCGTNNLFQTIEFHEVSLKNYLMLYAERNESGSLSRVSLSEMNNFSLKQGQNLKVLAAQQSKGDVTRDDSQRRFLAQDIIPTLLRHCFEWLQHGSNIATL